VQPRLEYFHSEIPSGRRGQWSIEKIVFPERTSGSATDMRPDCFRYRPGTYTRLQRGDTQFMTDLYDEWWTQRLAITEALSRGGQILITGLGLGLVAEAILRSGADRIEQITVIEQSADVIDLVAPYLRQRYDGRIRVLEADAFSWPNPAKQRFSVCWHDIWPDPSASTNTEEMVQLEKHYSPWCDWQGFWPAEYLKALEGEAAIA
jgi:spermidine synthase